MTLFGGVEADATLSTCGTYRYSLTRDWFPGLRRRVLWIMLNPSTADAAEDDPTIRRCRNFARAWGYDGIVVGNLFALRSVDPKALYASVDPVGPDNDLVLASLLDAASVRLVVAAWGTHGSHQARDARVCDIARKRGRVLHVLGLTAKGQPRHPLYVRGGTTPLEWSA